jgi:hypothetical protein
MKPYRIFITSLLFGVGRSAEVSTNAKIDKPPEVTEESIVAGNSGRSKSISGSGYLE